MAGQRIDIKILTNVSDSISAIKKLNSALETVEASVKQIEGAFKKNNNSVKAATRGFNKINTSLKLTNSVLKKTSKDLTTVNNGFKKVGVTAKTAMRKTNAETKKASASFKNFKAGLAAGLGFGAVDLATRAIFALVGAFKEGIVAAKNFEKQISEINTLLPDTAQITEDVSDKFLEFSVQFGKDKTQQTRAFYDIVSAGIRGASTQLDVLVQSNKAAVAGLVDVQTAADILTSALNAYSLTGLTAQEASDALFVAVREGKTRFDELAATMGRVAPIAASAGVSFEDLSGTVAFLTKTGISTDIAVTSLRQALATLLKPTEQTKQAAAELGIEFDANALKTKGLVGVFKDIREATNGNNAALNKLFPNIRALTAAIAIATGDFDDYQRVVNETNHSLGATSKAFEKIADDSSFAMDQAGVSIGNLFQSIGDKFLPLLGDISRVIVALLNSNITINDVFKDSTTTAAELEKVNSQIQGIEKSLISLAESEGRGLAGQAIEGLEKQLKLLKDRQKILQDTRAEEKRIELTNQIADDEEALFNNIKRAYVANIELNNSFTETKKELSDIAKLSDEQLLGALEKIKNVGKTQSQIFIDANKRAIDAVNEAVKRKLITETEATTKIKDLNIKLSEDLKTLDIKRTEEAKKESEKRLAEQQKALNVLRDAAADPIKFTFEGIQESGGFSNFAGFLNEEATAGLTAGIANAIAGGKEGAKSLVTGLATQLTNLVIPGLGDSLGPLFELFAQGPEATKKTVEEFSKSLPTIFQGFIEAIPVFLTTLTDNLDQIVKGLIIALAKASPELMKAMIFELPFELAKAAPDIAAALVSAIAKGVPNAIISAVKREAKNISREFGKVVAKSFKDGVAKFFESLGKITKRFIKSFADAYKKIANIIEKVFVTLFKRLGKAFEKVFSKFTKVLIDVGKELFDVFDKVFEAIAEAGKKVFDRIFGDFESGKLFEIIKDFGLEVADVLEDAFSKAITEPINTLVQKVKEIGSAIKQAVANSANTVGEAFKSVGNKIADGISNGVSVIGDKFTSLGSKVIDGISSGLDSIGNSVQEKLVAPFKKLGSSIVDGITESLGSIGDKFEDLGSSIVDGLKEALSDVGNIFKKLFEFDGGGTSAVENFLGFDFPFIAFAKGGMVGGSAKSSGDSALNDIVPALLSPGEIVLPRTAVSGGGEGIVSFLSSIGAPGFQGGGVVEGRGLSSLLEDIGLGGVSDYFGGLESSVIAEASAALDSFGVGGLFDILEDPFEFIKDAANLVQDNISKAASGLGTDALKDLLGAIREFGLPSELVGVIEGLQKIGTNVNIAKDLDDIVKDPIKYVKSKVGDAATTLFKPNFLKLMDPSRLATGGVIPEGFPNDSFPALLTSNERVVDPNTNNDLTDFLASGNDVTNALLAQVVELLGTPQTLESNLELDGETLATAILNLNRSNARLT